MPNSGRCLLSTSLGVAASIATLAFAACSGLSTTPPPPLGASYAVPAPSLHDFKFKTIVNPADRTFNEALGINDGRTETGYYGAGLQPPQGYLAVPPFSKKDFTSENYPDATQTTVNAINGSGDTAGGWAVDSGTVQGFIDWNGVFTSYSDPNATGATEILGLNDSGVAVGFYSDSHGDRNGFTLNQATGTFQTLDVPGATNTTASGINDSGDVVGYYSSGSETVGFLEKNDGSTTISYPGAVLTMALGINAHDSVVGSYVDSYGKTHGFLLTSPLKNPQWRSIDVPQGVGTTMLNGINDRLNMVGSYVDASGDTIGVLVERKKT
jgi:hypothetical protein